MDMKHIIIDYLNLVCVSYLTKFHTKYLYQKDILIIVWSSMAKAGIRRVYLQFFNDSTLPIILNLTYKGIYTLLLLDQQLNTQIGGYSHLI